MLALPIGTWFYRLTTPVPLIRIFFFFNDTATPEFYPFSLPAALPILPFAGAFTFTAETTTILLLTENFSRSPSDPKSTRLNSSHVRISYAVFCLKKKIVSSNNRTKDPQYTPASSPLHLCASRGCVKHR